MMAPMCDRSADRNGQVTTQQINYMLHRSGVAGTIVTGYAYVNDSGIVEPRQLSAADDSDITGLKKYADRDGDVEKIYHHIARSGNYSTANVTNLLHYHPRHTILETINDSVHSYIERGVIQYPEH